MKLIRVVKENEAEALLDLVKQVEAESPYMLHGAGERKTTVESMRKMITTSAAGENSSILVAEEKGELAGYCLAMGGKANRIQHSAYIVIGILEAHHGKGIGTAFFTTVEHWAKSQDLRRLELTVTVENEAAIGLYKKAGFDVEGVKKDSLLIGGVFKDEYYMAKLL
ncbi:GNAT family N-acetyltransferase [Lentibacillus sp. N15]|uniref:GNAT family N-acetyltransferase n=1 Tax=Lentibacillus songyuanensis TaxID=3136161 RepID=UPI0031BA5BD2